MCVSVYVMWSAWFLLKELFEEVIMNDNEWFWKASFQEKSGLCGEALFCLLPLAASFINSSVMRWALRLHPQGQHTVWRLLWGFGQSSTGNWAATLLHCCTDDLLQFRDEKDQQLLLSFDKTFSKDTNNQVKQQKVGLLFNTAAKEKERKQEHFIMDFFHGFLFFC